MPDDLHTKEETTSGGRKGMQNNSTTTTTTKELQMTKMVVKISISVGSVMGYNNGTVRYGFFKIV